MQASDETGTEQCTGSHIWFSRPQHALPAPCRPLHCGDSNSPLYRNLADHRVPSCSHGAGAKQHVRRGRPLQLCPHPGEGGCGRTGGARLLQLAAAGRAIADERGKGEAAAGAPPAGVSQGELHRGALPATGIELQQVHCQLRLVKVSCTGAACHK